MSRQIGFTSNDIKQEPPMPKIGTKKFPYTKSGKAAAAAAKRDREPSKSAMAKKLKKAR